MIFSIFQLLAGIALLFFGGDWLVDGSVALARRFRVSPLVIGLTIVGFGTSAPELLVSLAAAVKHTPDIALGNVIGSNIANIGLVLALSALLCPVSFAQRGLFAHWLTMLAASLVLAAVSAGLGIVSRPVAAVFLLALAAFLVVSVLFGRRDPPSPDEPPLPLPRALFLLLLAFAALPSGANLLVDAASDLALALGVPQRVIGLTIVAVGTSLPELAASLAAAFKRQPDLSVGNIVGSNLFNILAILGCSALVRPLPFPFDAYRLDLGVMLLLALLLALPLLIARLARRPPVLSRPLALLLFLPYVFYVAFLF
ncbi:MAG: calcium/sodium antiporter [Kiritimatiellae bacterium]|nr:calcium/sodium antiporter [Kiritimatiellia bacterium]